MKRNNNKKRLETNKKIFILLLFLAFLIFLYIIRLFQLQILDVQGYKSKGEDVSLIGRINRPERGNIYDRNGKPLAISQKVESLYLLPVTSEEKSKEAEEAVNNNEYFNSLGKEEQNRLIRIASLPTYNDEEIDKIANVLAIDSKGIYNLINSNREGFIYRALNKSQKAQLNLLDLPYLLFLNIDDRYYPNNEILANTLGFIDNDGQAYYGLEKYYDEILTGELGYSEFFKALQGTEIPYTSNSNLEAKDSQNLITNIDIDLQKILHKRLKEAMLKFKPMSATAVLSNPQNGEILAIESIPTFNSNNPRSMDSDIDRMFLDNIRISSNDYLLDKWQNKAVSSQYEPGSVFKAINAAIALEVDPSLADKVYEDDGYYELAPGVVIRSWRYWDPHGPQKLREAFKNSSNPVFVQVLNDIGKERYMDNVQGFRFGQKSGIDLPGEVSGTFPKDASISDVDFGTLSYGHYVNVNSVQFISALNSLVNGGKYYKPHIGQAIVDDQNNILYELGEDYQKKTISEATSNEIKDYLSYAADYYGLNNEELKFGAKTGSSVKYTSESIFRNEDDPDGLYTSIYISYPADEPEYSLLVVLDEPLVRGDASSSALPLGKAIMYDIVAHTSDKEIPTKNDYVRIPDLLGSTIGQAKEILNEISLELSYNKNYGNYHLISNQYPEANNMIEINSEINVESNGQAKVPNLVGMDIDDALTILEENKINYERQGQGKKVIDQSVSHMDILGENEKLTIKLGE